MANVVFKFDHLAGIDQRHHRQHLFAGVFAHQQAVVIIFRDVVAGVAQLVLDVGGRDGGLGGVAQHEHAGHVDVERAGQGGEFFVAEGDLAELRLRQRRYRNAAGLGQRLQGHFPGLALGAQAGAHFFLAHDFGRGCIAGWGHVAVWLQGLRAGAGPASPAACSRIVRGGAGQAESPPGQGHARWLRGLPRAIMRRSGAARGRHAGR
ncbi:hypothetical protein D3C72_1779420 [compost metagenome]